MDLCRFGFVASIFCGFEFIEIFLKVGVYADAVATANQVPLFLALASGVGFQLLGPFIEVGISGIAIQLR